MKKSRQLVYGWERQGPRSDVLWLCRMIAADWCRSFGRDTALEMASERYFRPGLTFWQRANWRMIRRLINTRVQFPHPED